MVPHAPLVYPNLDAWIERQLSAFPPLTPARLAELGLLLGLSVAELAEPAAETHSVEEARRAA